MAYSIAHTDLSSNSRAPSKRGLKRLICIWKFMTRGIHHSSLFPSIQDTSERRCRILNIGEDLHRGIRQPTLVYIRECSHAT